MQSRVRFVGDLTTSTWPRLARLGIDTFDRHLQRIEEDPLDGTWFQAWELARDEERAEVLAQRAADLLDLGAVSYTHLTLPPKA